jgi:hypothetical protein
MKIRPKSLNFCSPRGLTENNLILYRPSKADGSYWGLTSIGYDRSIEDNVQYLPSAMVGQWKLSKKIKTENDTAQIFTENI